MPQPKMRQIAHRDHIAVWLASCAEVNLDPLTELPGAVRPRLFRGCALEYLDTVLSTGVAWPATPGGYLYADRMSNVGWAYREYPEAREGRHMEVVLDLDSFPNKLHRHYYPAGDPYAALQHVVVAGDESEIVGVLHQIQGVVFT